ncbi:unnamed protein product [Mucor hiemalis]
MGYSRPRTISFHYKEILPRFSWSFDCVRYYKTRFIHEHFSWLDEFKINDAHPESIIMLVGNKSDLEKSRAISEEEAKAFAEKNGLMFMETSALDSTNVKKAFESLIHNIFDKLSSKLTTLDDKKAEIMRGQAIQLSAPIESSENSKSSSCAC